MKTIQNQMSEFRNMLSNSLIKHKLLKTTNYWFQIHSSMDCVEDTQLAINYFKESDFPKDNGGKYIFIYGLFQALFAQQNALKDIGEVINYNIDYKKNKYPELYKLRDIRNKIVGHPTKIGDNKWKSTHSIVRTSMTKTSIEYRSKYKNNHNADYEKINIKELIIIQKKEITSIINNLMNQIELRDKEIKMKFKDDKLINLFDNCLLDNYFVYMLEFFDGDHTKESIAKMGFKMIKEVIENFKQMHKERYHSNEFVNLDIYKLLEIFNQWLDNKTQLNRLVMYFLTNQLKIEFDKLKEDAKEIDNQFLIKE